MVNYNPEETAFNISWNALFSVVPPDPDNGFPSVFYTIIISNSTGVIIETTISETHYLFQDTFDRCIERTVVITSLNLLGNGNSTPPLIFPSKFS